MADTSGRILYSCHLRADEHVSKAEDSRGSTWSNITIKSKEVNTSTTNTKYYADSLKLYDSAGIGHGYTDGKRVYHVANTSALSPLDQNDSEAMTHLKYAWIKHTGYQGTDFTHTDCDITSGSENVSVTDSSGIVADMCILNSNFPSGTYVLSVDATLTPQKVVMSQLSTATATGETIRFLGQSTTVNATDYLAVYNGTTLITLLPPGGGISIPIFSSSSWTTAIGSQQLQVASKTVADVDIYGSNNIAVEYLLFEDSD
jgi:hypothetical protein